MKLYRIKPLKIAAESCHVCCNWGSYEISEDYNDKWLLTVMAFGDNYQERYSDPESAQEAAQTHYESNLNKGLETVDFTPLLEEWRDKAINSKSEKMGKLFISALPKCECDTSIGVQVCEICMGAINDKSSEGSEFDNAYFDELERRIESDLKPKP